MVNDTRVPSAQLTLEQVVLSLQGQPPSLIEQAKQVTSIKIQQSVNCCGLTSVAYALTALGYPTTVDELFLTVGVNVESAVGDGMTLAEIHDATLRYVSRAKLPIFVECYHFDAFSTSLDAFVEACAAEGDSGMDDLLVLNFHSGIAHGWPKGGGGHFSVLTGLDAEGGQVIMADVHGIKYGTYWSTPTKQMFEAMADKDSCGRARGMLRFGLLDKQLSRPLGGLKTSLVDWTAPPKAYSGEALEKYVPQYWDEGLGVKNMEGVSALAAAMRLIDGDSSKLGRLDEIMRALRESYSWHLNTYVPARKIAEMSAALKEKGLTSAETSVVPVSGCTGESLRDALQAVGCGQDGVAVLVGYDVNVAHGAELLAKEKGEAGALSHGTKSWSLIAGFDEHADVTDEEGLVVAPAHNVILAGRLWTCSIDRMAAAIQAIGGDDCSIVVLDRRA